MWNTKKTRLAEKLGIRVLSQTHLNQHKQYKNQLRYHSPSIELSINNEQCYNVNDTQARLSLKEIATDINNEKYVVRIELLKDLFDRFNLYSNFEMIKSN